MLRAFPQLVLMKTLPHSFQAVLMLRRKNGCMPKRELEMKRKIGWRTEVAREADGEMYQPVGTGLQVSMLEKSVTAQAMETE